MKTYLVLSVAASVGLALVGGLQRASWLGSERRADLIDFYRGLVTEITAWTQKVNDARRVKAVEHPEAGSVEYFSETVPLDRQGMLSYLAEHGYDTQTLTAQVPDSSLAEMCRLCDSFDSKEGAAPAPEQTPEGQTMDETGGTGGMGGGGDMPGGGGDMPGGGLGASPPDQMAENCQYAEGEMPEATSPEHGKMLHQHGQRIADHGQKMMEKYAEYAGGGDAPNDTSALTDTGKDMGKKDTGKDKEMSGDKKKKGEADMDKFSEADVQRMVGEALVKVLPAALNTALGAQLEPVRRDIDTFKEATERDAVRAFIKTYTEKGHLDGAEMDRTSGLPTIEDRLMALPNTEAVHKFSENGKEVALTPRQAEMEAIKRRRPHRLGSVVIASGDVPEDREVAKLDQMIDQFSEEGKAQWRKGGMTKERCIEGFKAERKFNGSRLTAEQYLTTFGVAG